MINLEIPWWPTKGDQAHLQGVKEEFPGILQEYFLWENFPVAPATRWMDLSKSKNLGAFIIRDLNSTNIPWVEKFCILFCTWIIVELQIITFEISIFFPEERNSWIKFILLNNWIWQEYSLSKKNRIFLPRCTIPAGSRDGKTNRICVPDLVTTWNVTSVSWCHRPHGSKVTSPWQESGMGSAGSFGKTIRGEKREQQENYVPVTVTGIMSPNWRDILEFLVDMI